MCIGNVVLLDPISPWSLARSCVSPYYIFILILLLSFVGVYSVNNSLFDIYLLLFFGIWATG
jgi:TctA family transporter